MKVYFRNSYSAKIWVSIMRYDPDSCRDDGNWATEGWWGIDPGQQVWAFSTNYRYVFYYADAEDGKFWAGEYGPVYVYYEAFSSCLKSVSTAAYGTVGMRLIDTNNSDIIINLTP